MHVFKHQCESRCAPPQALTYAIQRSCVNKAEVVAEDELEDGVRATLNLGHTFGHAIETVAGYGACSQRVEGTCYCAAAAALHCFDSFHGLHAVVTHFVGHKCPKSRAGRLRVSSAHSCMAHPTVSSRTTLYWNAGSWLHGEAVSAGMVMAADMSHRLGWIGEDVLDRTRTLLQRANLPVVPPQVRRDVLDVQ